MNSSNIFQVAIIVLSLAVAVFYIPGRIEELREKEEEIAEFQKIVSQVEELNRVLSSHLGTINSLSPQELSRIETYLPSEIDPVAVARDIDHLARQAGLNLEKLTTAEREEETEAGQDAFFEEEGVKQIDYRVDSRLVIADLSGEYQDFKEFLQAIEQNDYPFRVIGMEIATPEPELDTSSNPITPDGQEFSVTLETYSFNLE